ncbi:MAG: hypothetical protein N3D80_01610 [Ignavibacterium album]|nr:hypothetical protein [Ignavibacterium album]
MLVVLGVISAYTRFYLGIKPSFLTIPVFTIYSSFIDTKTFQIITNNISEEIVILLLLIGLLLINFSKEKFEDDIVDHFRFKALLYSVLINSILLLLSTVFIYGLAFISILSINIFSQLFIYQIFFRIFIIVNKRN